MDPVAVFFRVTESLETFASAQYAGALPAGDGIVSSDSGAGALQKILRFVAAECGVPILTVAQLFGGTRDFRALATGVLCELHREGEAWAQRPTGKKCNENTCGPGEFRWRVRTHCRAARVEEPPPAAKKTNCGEERDCR